jgi:hypothetical protein
MPDDLVRIDPPIEDNRPLSLIAQAIAKNMSIADLKGLFDLQERFEKQQAAQKFADALTAFQAEMPQVEKWKEGAKGAYKFAPYETIMEAAKPLLVKHAIVATFNTQQEPTGITITCRIRVGTHFEETALFMPTPQGNNMINAAQNQGITLSYAKRNALKAALNIVERGEDLDGTLAGDFVNGSQIAELNGLIEQCGKAGAPIHFQKLLEWLGVDSLDKLPQRDLAKAVTELRNKLAQAKKGGVK